MNYRIIGTGRSEPLKTVTNRDLEGLMDTSDEWIVRRTGIKERRYAQDQTMRELALMAAQAAIEDAGIENKDIGYIVFATISPDYITPSQGSVLAMDLGIDCPAVDINGACAGFLYALRIAGGLFPLDNDRKILAVGMDLMSRFLHMEDRSTAVLFGDGGGAAVLSSGNSVLSYNESSSPAIDPLHIVNSSEKRIVMDGQAVYRFAVGQIVREVGTCLEKAGLKADDIDFFIPHQANMRIIESAAEKLGIPMEKVVITLDRCGNTSAGSVPFSLDILRRSGKLGKGMRLAMVSFGAGLTSACTIIEWNI